MNGTLVAIGGFMSGSDNADVHARVLAASEISNPKICYLPLASGDSDLFVDLFHQQYSGFTCRPRHLNLLRHVDEDPQAVLADQDIVHLGGGSTPILLAGLRILGLVDVLTDLLRRGGVIAGESAGAHVMFGGSITDSLGPGLQVFSDGLGFIDGSCAAHADETRVELLTDALAAGELGGPAWALGDGTVTTFSADGVVTAAPYGCGSVTRLDYRSGVVHRLTL